jgi:hypothetical protein
MQDTWGWACAPEVARTLIRSTGGCEGCHQITRMQGSIGSKSRDAGRSYKRSASGTGCLRRTVGQYRSSVTGFDAAVLCSLSDSGLCPIHALTKLRTVRCDNHRQKVTSRVGATAPACSALVHVPWVHLVRTMECAVVPLTVSGARVGSAPRTEVHT